MLLVQVEQLKPALKILMNEEEGLKVILKKAVLNAINRAHELKN